MPRGGHSASGPPPDPNSLRQSLPKNAAGWTTLPAEGRSGPAPAWPLVDQTDREVELWEDLWTRPQAAAWEDLDQRYEVAMFVRKLAEAERPRASVELQKVVRQYLDSLGLSVQGMLRNRWKIAEKSGKAGDAKSAARAVPKRRSARDRLKVIDGAGGA